MFDFRFVIISFDLANSFFSTSAFVEFSSGKLWMFAVTFILAFPISLLTGRLAREIEDYEESREEPFRDIFRFIT